MADERTHRVKVMRNLPKRTCLGYVYKPRGKDYDTTHQPDDKARWTEVGAKWVADRYRKQLYQKVGPQQARLHEIRVVSVT